MGAETAHAHTSENVGASKPLNFELAYRSGDYGTRAALDTLMTELTALKLDPDIAGTIELVMAEVLNNVVEHAYSDSADGQIEICVEQTGTALLFLVRDEGVTMPNCMLPEGALADSSGPLDSLPEGGFGWFLILTLARDIGYRSCAGKNELSLTIETV